MKNSLVLSLCSCLTLAGAFVFAEAAPEPASPAAPSAETKPADAPPASASAPEFPLKSEWFDKIIDDYDEQEDAQTLEEHSLEDILVALKNSTPELLAKSVDKDANYRNLMLHPERYRGHVAEIFSILRYVEHLEVRENRAGVKEVWRGQVAGQNRQMITFCSLQPPPADLKVGKPVHFVGIFMKRFAYLNDEKPGMKLTWTPIIFVHRIEPFVEPEPASSMTQATAIFFLIVFAMGVAWVLISRGKAQPRAVRAKATEKSSKP